ncbi:hypothetical protein JTB14_012813 [Gonioctena quinquepunctata]|nr:hypothetical protein JTB14_012813 [Gonioctena quinquepunctata]
MKLISPFQLPLHPVHYFEKNFFLTSILCYRAFETEVNYDPLQQAGDEKGQGNSPLLFDTNIAHHLPENSDAVKHKRCPRVGASLQPRTTDIAGAQARRPLERRDLKTQLYGKFCATCLVHNSCELLSECPVCERWCTKMSTDDTDATINENNLSDVVGVTREIIPTEEPVVSLSSRSNFEDEGRKNVYTITSLRTGSTKEMILRLLGISNEDIDTVVIWVTTHSNQPPVTASEYQETLDPVAENMAETVKEELKAALQEKMKEHGEKLLNNNGEELDKIIRDVLAKIHPSLEGPKLSLPDTPQMVASRSGMGSKMLPRYPIESDADGFVVPQTLNPDIIEGPPDMMTLNGEGEPGNLGATNNQGGEVISEQDETPLGMQQDYFDTPSVVLPSPSIDENQEIVQDGHLQTAIPSGAENYARDDTPMAEKRPQPFTKKYPLTAPTEDGSNKELTAVDTNILGSTPPEEMVSSKTQQVPGASLQDIIDNVKDKMASPKNGQRKSRPTLKTANPLESDGDQMEPIEKTYLGKSLGSRSRVHRPFNHRTSSQDDNIGSRIGDTDVAGSENEDSTPLNSAPGAKLPKIPLLDRMKTFNPNEFMERLKAKNLQGQQKSGVPDGEIDDTPVGSEFAQNAPSEIAVGTIHEQSQGRHNGQHHGQNHEHRGPNHGQHHGQNHGPRNGQQHRPNLFPTNGQHHGPSFWNGHRSSMLGDSQMNNPVNMVAPKGVNPGFENEMLAEPAVIDQIPEDTKNAQLTSPKLNTVENSPMDPQSGNKVIPAKYNIGARANELIQKLKERQELKKASPSISNPLSEKPKQNIIGSTRSMADETPADTDRQPVDPVMQIREPMQNSRISNFDNAEAALGKVRGLSQNIQEDTEISMAPINDEGVVSSFGNVPNFEINTVQRTLDSDKEGDELVDGLNGPERVGSQPLENILEIVQPTMSRSGGFWSNKFSDRLPVQDGQLTRQQHEVVDGLETGMMEEPSLGSAENGELFTVGESNVNPNTRQQFEGIHDQPYSTSLGSIVTAEQPVDMNFQRPTDMFFYGSGIKLPLKMVKENDGVTHLSVDLDKLCSCNNITCPKNHTVLEIAVENILENDAELKEQLEPIATGDAGRGDLDPRNNGQEDYGEVPLGMAPPQNVYGDDAMAFQDQEAVNMQSRMGGFEDNRMMDPRGVITQHRNQRDTVEGNGFLDLKNKIAGGFDSMELQSDNAGILKRSPESKATTRTQETTKTTTDKIKSVTEKPINESPNGILTNGNMIRPSTEGKKETSNDLTSGNSNKIVTNEIKNSTAEPNSFQDFLSKRMDHIKSTMTNLEKRNDELKKEMIFPQQWFKNILNTEKIVPKLNTSDASPILGSRIGDFFEKAPVMTNELYDNLASITKPFKFKALENQLKSNLDHIGETVSNYTKQDEKIIKDEVAQLEKINGDPVVRKEVGIASSILKFFKDLAADRNGGR